MHKSKILNLKINEKHMTKRRILGSEKKKFHHNKISLFFYLELYKKNTIKSRYWLLKYHWFQIVYQITKIFSWHLINLWFYFSEFAENLPAR